MINLTCQFIIFVINNNGIDFDKYKKSRGVSSNMKVNQNTFQSVIKQSISLFSKICF